MAVWIFSSVMPALQSCRCVWSRMPLDESVAYIQPGSVSDARASFRVLGAIEPQRRLCRDHLLGLCGASCEGLPTLCCGETSCGDAGTRRFRCSIRVLRTLIVRPQKLLTAMTNTPLGRLVAASPGLIANRIAARLEDPLQPE